MATHDSLKSLVRQYIKTNGQNEITGQILQNVLIAMIDELGGENGYAGVATPSTNPGAPDGKVFYFATEAGTYTHFDGATLAKGIHLLVFNGVIWSHQTLYTIDSEVTSGSNNLITSGAVYNKIINAINALEATVSKSAGADGLSLSLTEVNGKVTNISGSIAPQTYDAYGAASAAQIAAATDATNKVNAAKTQILGDAASDYNTLGKLEDKIQAEASRAAATENALNADKADKATTLAGYGINDAYTKTEVNGLVSTPHQNYVTVSTYASLPATGSADTIYRVSNYNGSTSQVDASVYSEYAWNGSGYTFLRVDSQIGEVFDITVYNSNTKYADLAAALGTNGANVPSSIRRGGMSVKFVQSSDNKYVQYLYVDTSTAAADYTNLANWQKVNLEKELLSLSAIDPDVNYVSNLVKNMGIDELGKQNVNSNRSYICVKIVDGSSTITIDTDVPLKTGNFYSGVPDVVGGSNFISPRVNPAHNTQTIVSGAKYYIVMLDTSNSYPTYVRFSQEGNYVSQKLFGEEIKLINILVGYSLQKYPLLNTNELSSSEHLAWHTYYNIPVKKGDIFIYEKKDISSLLSGYSYYIITDKDGVVLQRKDGTGTDGNFSTKYTMPEDGYISICLNINQTSNIIIFSKNTELFEQLNDMVEFKEQNELFDIIEISSKSNKPLLSDNTLSETNPSWHTYYKIFAPKGCVFNYVKGLQALSSGYSYYIITDTLGNVLQRLDGNGSGSAVNYSYAMPQDGYISACFYDVAGAFKVAINIYLNKNMEITYNNALSLNNTKQDSIPFRSIYKFGVIGDSLSVGHMTNPINDDVIYRNLKFSWPQILARKNGQICLNFGFSGASATTWFTNTTYQCPFVLSDADNLCQAYIIGLGANLDAGGIGSMSDIDWDNGDNNASTFYGQYARIIQLIRSVAPKAPIFCLTLPYPRENLSINSAIRSIATNAHVSDHTFVVDLTEYNDFLKNDVVGELVTVGNYSKYYYNYHFVAPGYAICSDMIEKAISKIMNKNAGVDVIDSIGQIPFGSNDIIN